MSNLKNVTVKNFTEDGEEYLELTGTQEIDNKKYTIMLNKIKLGDIEIIKTDGKATHIQLPLVSEQNGSVGQVLLNQENIKNEGEVDNMEIKIGNSSLIITNKKGVTIELDSVKNRIHDKKIRKYEGNIIGEITTVLSFKFINDLSKTKDYFNVGEKYVILAKDTIVDENNNLVRQNEITDLGTLRIVAYNEERGDSGNYVVSEVIFRK